jgi:hypothetical protein
VGAHCGGERQSYKEIERQRNKEIELTIKIPSKAQLVLNNIAAQNKLTQHS